MAVGSVGFSRGVHYWEFNLERYDGNADIAFGIGRIDICREMILGKFSRQFTIIFLSVWFASRSFILTRLKS